MIELRPIIRDDAFAFGLIAFKLTSSQDRKALGDWIDGQADRDEGKRILAELPTKQTGEAIVWVPARGVLTTEKFPAKTTFDSSRTPKRGEKVAAGELKPLDLGSLRDRLAAVEADAKANDPKALKAEIATLRRQVATAGPTLDPKAIAEAEQRGYDRGFTEGGDQVMRGIANLTPDLAASVGRAKAACADAERLLEAFSTFSGAMASERKARPVAAPTRAAAVTRPRSVAPPAGPPPDGLGKPQMRVLSSLAFWHSVGHEAPTREQVAGVAGYKPGSGNFNNILGGLKSAGMIAYPAAGVVHMNGGAPDIAPPSSDEARDLLLSVFNGPQRKIVEAMADAERLSRTEIAERVGYQPGSGNFNNLLGSLRTLCVIDYPQSGHAALSDWARELLA